MFIYIIVGIASFMILYFGSEWLLRGSLAIAYKISLPKAVIGITLVALGTSSPELVVNLIAATSGHTGFALSNVAGSNLANLCIGIGICSIVTTLYVTKNEFKIDLIFFSLAPLTVFIFLLASSEHVLPFVSLFVLILFFFFYLYSIKKRTKKDEKYPEIKDTTLVGFSIFLAGCLFLYVGGEMVLYSAIGIASKFGLSETIVGLTIVAVGTSIPDIMTSVIASLRGEHSIAIGNILGSNIFNVFFVLSGTLLLSGQSLAGNKNVLYDYGFTSIISIVFLVAVFIMPKLKKRTGASLIFSYIAYMSARIYFLN